MPKCSAGNSFSLSRIAFYPMRVETVRKNNPRRLRNVASEREERRARRDPYFALRVSWPPFVFLREPARRDSRADHLRNTSAGISRERDRRNLLIVL